MMPRRLKIMLAALAGVAALLVLDRPAPVQPEVSQVVRREPRAAAPAAVAPPVLNPDDPVPDLFAQTAGTHAAAALAQAETPDASEAQAPEWTLLGFKEEDSVREAYVQYNGDVLTARTGALLDKRYRVLALRADAVDIRDNTSGVTRRIGFRDQE